MDSSIITQIDAEIAKLQAVKELLSSVDSESTSRAVPAIHLMPKRKMSDAVRAKMSAAAKLRWKKKKAEDKQTEKVA